MRDVLVTGIGVVSALGETVEDYWRRLYAGEIAIRRASTSELGYDVPLVWAPIDNFRPEDSLDTKVVGGTDRVAQLLLVAAQRAIESSGLDALDPLRTGVVTGTSMGGLNSVIEAQIALDQGGVDALPNKVQLKMWPNMGAAQIAYQWGLHGPQLTLCTACASSADAIGTGARMIEAGIVDLAIVGGAESHLKPLILLSATGLGAASKSTDPLRASLPFDKNRSGMVVGEGAGVLVLESRKHAAARGSHAYGAVTGYGSLADSYHPSSPDPSGTWQTLTMQHALQDAGEPRQKVSAIIAHGTATRVGDAAEIRAIQGYLGSHAGQVKVASIKGHIGHTSGGSAVLSVVAALKALDSGMVVMNAGTTDPEDGADFEIVTKRPSRIQDGSVQVNAFGFGGQNASLLLSHP